MNNYWVPIVSFPSCAHDINSSKQRFSLKYYILHFSDEDIEAQFLMFPKFTYSWRNKTGSPLLINSFFSPSFHFFFLFSCFTLKHWRCEQLKPLKGIEYYHSSIQFPLVICYQNTNKYQNTIPEFLLGKTKKVALQYSFGRQWQSKDGMSHGM